MMNDNDELKNKGVIKTAYVEDAFKSVGRHLFVTGFPLDTYFVAW